MMLIRWPDPKKFYWQGAVVAAVGLLLLRSADDWHGALGLLSLPACLGLIGAGTGLLLWPGDSRLPQYACLASALGLLLLPFVALSGEGLTALFLAISLVAAYLCAGHASLQQYPMVESAPAAPRDWRGAAHVGTDEALLAWFKLVARPPREQQVRRMVAELEEWESWLKRKRWGLKPERWHPKPPELLKVEGQERRVWGQAYREIRFDSLYAPDAEMPGVERWTSYAANRQARAWVLEHPGAARPWLLCIHGYRMGEAWLDFRAFRPDFLHQQLGLNLVHLVLPLHGPRRRGMLSGDGYLDGDVIDLIHAQCQAQWDLRRVLSWLRLVKHAPAIGAYGISLGGYNAALLATLDSGLDAVVAGIPVTDLSTVQWRHYPEPQRQLLLAHGVDQARLQEALAGVSPLRLPVQLPAAQLAIFAGTADTLVWPDHPLALQSHWGGAALHWYDGAHLTFGHQPAVRRGLLDALRAGGVLEPHAATSVS